MTTETNAERFKQADELLTAIVEMGDGHGKHKEGIDVLEWLIQQAKRAEELEKAIDAKMLSVQTKDYVYVGPDDSVSYQLLKKIEGADE